MEYSDFGRKASSIGCNAAQAAENPLMALMCDYVRAKENYDLACHAFQQCSMQKADAEKQLLALSEKVSQVVQQGVYDPTVPQPCAPTPNVIGNGQYQGGLNPRY